MPSNLDGSDPRVGRRPCRRDRSALTPRSERDRLLVQLELQIERLPLAYLLSGPDLRYTRWNPAAEKMFGFTEVEVLRKHPSRCHRAAAVSDDV